jgi:ribonuclease Y
MLQTLAQLIPAGPTLAVSGVVTVILILVALAAGIAGTLVINKLMGKSALGQAQKEAKELLERARSEGETLSKQMELDARNAQAQRRESFEKEIEAARKELDEDRKRVAKREDNLDKKLDMLSTKEKYLDGLDADIKKRENEIAGKQEKLDELITARQQMLDELTEQKKNELLRIANISAEEAKKEAIKQVEEQSQHEAGQMVQRVMERAEQEAKQKSLDITLNAIQRYASEHTSNSTVSAIQIPSDDMKGRVIGREGRNIRAFEKATGVDVIVDDTPGVVVVSCFDPVRRAIASETLQRLLEDGRIHPSRIEELTEQVRKEMNERIIKFGNDAAIEINLPGLNPRINEMMGRLHYRTSYGQNILRHSLEVGYLCQVIAEQLGLDGTLARRAGYLHDIGKAMDHEVEGGHPAIGADFARKHGEKDIVLNAIAGHHNDIPSISPYTPIVMAADAISGARPGARRETLERYTKRLEQLEEIATGMKGVREAYAIQAGREVRVIVDPENVDDTNCHYIAREIAKRVSEEMTFPGEIKVTVLREMRTVEYAR